MTGASLPLEQRLLARQGALELDISRTELPPRLRPRASLGVLDISEYFGETSGGVRTYLLQKARYVESRPDLRQALLVPGARDAIRETDGVRCYSLHGPSIPFQKPYRFMLATRSTSRIVAHERPDIIEVGSSYFVPWLIRRATRRIDVPVVWFYHSNIPRIVSPRMEHARGVSRALSGLAAAYVRRLSRMVRRTLVASDFVLRDLERMGVEGTARVPLGVDLECFHPRRREHASQTRERRGLPGGPLALFVGRFAKEKDLDVLVEAWTEVGRRTGATLALVGDGPMRARLTAMAEERNVRVLAFEHDREGLADLYAAADLYVAPGPAETFGLSALEALASGTPVLSCDCGGVAEQVERSGAGALYRAGSAGAAAEAAVRLLQGDLGRLGRLGRDFAVRHHSWDVVFDQIFEVYRDVLAE
jgi:alpha-1,6-mannosyltransferase